MRTTEHTEQHLPRIARLLGFESESKWLTIRFAVSISLALEDKLNMKEKIEITKRLIKLFENENLRQKTAPKNLHPHKSHLKQKRKIE